MDAVTAQRTLVKSPPELWSEVSDAASLTRHLGEFGEIRITRTEAETTVAWEGELASGTVELEPSGWGTRVTLTALPIGSDEPDPEPNDDAVDQPPPAAAEGAAVSQPAALARPAAAPDLEHVAPQGASPATVPEPAPEPATPKPDAPPAVPDPAPEPAATVDPAPEAAAPEPEAATAVPDPAPEPAHNPALEAAAVPDGTGAPSERTPAKRGFWARLFRRSPRDPAPPPGAAPPGDGAVAAPALDEPATGDDPPETEQWDAIVIADPPAPAAAPPAPGTPPEPAAAPPAPAADPPAPAGDPPAPAAPARQTDPEGQTAEPDPEPVAAGDPGAVLANALDSLGAAHHRPFSRG